MNGHTPKDILGFICTLEAIRKLDGSEELMILSGYYFPLLCMGSEHVGETQITKNAASRCLRTAAAPGDRSESVHQLCKLFILPSGILWQTEKTLPCREAGAVSCTGRRPKGQGGNKRLKSLHTLVTPLPSLG